MVMPWSWENHGTGKTSLVRSIGNELPSSIYVNIPPTRNNFDFALMNHTVTGHLLPYLPTTIREGDVLPHINLLFVGLYIAMSGTEDDR